MLGSAGDSNFEVFYNNYKINTYRQAELAARFLVKWVPRRVPRFLPALGEAAAERIWLELPRVFPAASTSLLVGEAVLACVDLVLAGTAFVF